MAIECGALVKPTPVTLRNRALGCSDLPNTTAVSAWLGHQSMSADLNLNKVYRQTASSSGLHAIEPSPEDQVRVGGVGSGAARHASPFGRLVVLEWPETAAQLLCGAQSEDGARICRPVAAASTSVRASCAATTFQF